MNEKIKTAGRVLHYGIFHSKKFNKDYASVEFEYASPENGQMLKINWLGGLDGKARDFTLSFLHGLGMRGNLSNYQQVMDFMEMRSHITLDEIPITLKWDEYRGKRALKVAFAGRFVMSKEQKQEIAMRVAGLKKGPETKTPQTAKQSLPAPLKEQLNKLTGEKELPKVDESEKLPF